MKQILLILSRIPFGIQERDIQYTGIASKTAFTRTNLPARENHLWLQTIKRFSTFPTSQNQSCFWYKFAFKEKPRYLRPSSSPAVVMGKFLVSSASSSCLNRWVVNEDLPKCISIPVAFEKSSKISRNTRVSPLSPEQKIRTSSTKSRWVIQQFGASFIPEKRP